MNRRLSADAARNCHARIEMRRRDIHDVPADRVEHQIGVQPREPMQVDHLLDVPRL